MGVMLKTLLSGVKRSYRWDSTGHVFRVTFYIVFFLLSYQAERCTGQTTTAVPVVEPVTTSPVTPTPTKNPFVCTHGVDDNGKQLKAGLHDAFIDNTKKVDFVLIIDRSMSITLEGYNHTKIALKRLLDYLIDMNLMLIHPERTRISILTLGSQTYSNRDGIRSQHPTTICEIDKFVNELQHQKYNQSEITDALKWAKTIFRASYRKDDPTIKKIVFLFFDGEHTGQNPAEYIRELAADGVEVFAAGVGSPAIKGWMTKQHELNLIALVTDVAKHYACVETWEEILHDTTPKPGPGPERISLPDYCLTPGSSGATCLPACTGSKVCACNIVQRKVQCKEKEEVTCKVPLPTTPPVPPKTLWIAVSVPVGVVLIAVAFLICFLVWKKRQKGPSGPPLPIPPVPRRMPRRGNYIYGSEPIYVNPQQMDTNNGNMAQETTAMQYQTLKEIEREMPGWGEFLIEKAREHGFRHISIHDVARRRWASTPGKRVKTKEIKEIERSFSASEGNYINTDVRVGGIDYKVDHAKSRESKISANSKDGDAVFISQQGPYIVVGIAPPGIDNSCQEALLDLDQYLLKSTDEDFDPADEEEIYHNTATIEAIRSHHAYGAANRAPTTGFIG